MKKLYTLITSFVLFMNYASAQDISIPEGGFKDFLIGKYPGCFVNVDIDGHLLLNTACTSITSEDSLEFHNLTDPQGNPITLEGIQYFVSLKYLDCSGGGNILNSPPLPATLQYLNFSLAYGDRPFGIFPDILPNGLRYFNCSQNDLATIGHFPDSLRYLDCSWNAFISTIPALPSKLDTLICGAQKNLSPYSNNLTALPPLPATLTYLDCSNHAFTTLPPLNAGLKYLNCSHGEVNTNPETITFTMQGFSGLPAGLQYMNCSYNGLTSLSGLPASLTYLDCSYSRFDNNGAGTIAGTGITSLGPLPAALTYLNCYSAALQCLPLLPASLTALYIDRDSITCLPNSGTYTVYPSGPQIPLCTVTNNSNQCVFTPVISGRFYYDNNSNGVLDAGEDFRSDVGVMLQNGTVSFSNSVGYFEISGGIGLNTITVVNPPFYTAVPSTASYTFTDYNQTATADYALQPSAVADSMRISIIPWNTARPGFDHYYQVNYENVGTTTISPVIKFNYNPAKLTYTSASVAGITDNGSALTLNVGAFTPGSNGSFFAHFTVSTSVSINDTIFVDGSATANSRIGTGDAYSIIRGSFDPNDKHATPQLTPQQVVAGNFINYTIRFQNTGNFLAENIVITDTLSSLVIPESFQITASSHPCKVTRNGNRISFEFLNILLPDQISDEPGSHGYVQFRLKPQSGLILNDVIQNDAAIYFDYNSPVITNTANTFIQLTALPLNLLAFKGYVSEESRILLLWNTVNENNTAYFNIEHSIDGLTFIYEGKVTALRSGDHSYSFNSLMPGDEVYYRLKIFNTDGKFVYSPVVLMKRSNKTAPITILNNPARNTLNIIVTNNSLVKSYAVLVNVSGQVVKKILLTAGQQEITVKGLAPGTYYLKTMDHSLGVIIR